MKLTKRTIYGMQALADIAQNQADGPVKLREISGRLGVSKGFLEQIFGPLAAGGLVESRRGPSGGFILQRAASEITLYHVLLIMEGPIQIVPCIRIQEPAQQGCPLADRCPTSPAWEDIHGQIVGLFRNMTVRDLCR